MFWLERILRNAKNASNESGTENIQLEFRLRDDYR